MTPILPHQVVVTILLAIIAWAIGSIIWAVRLEGRVNLVERLVENASQEHREAYSRIEHQLELIQKTMMTIRVTCAAFHHDRDMGSTKEHDHHGV